jgi:hypothetical protein
MNFLYHYFILCISLVFHLSSVWAMEEEGQTGSTERAWITWIPQFIQESQPLHSSSPPQNYRDYPDYQYLSNRFKNDIESGKPFKEIQFQIGSCYFSGVKDYININYDAAAWWYHQSARLQHNPARDMLELLTMPPYENEKATLYLGLLKAQTALGVVLPSGDWESC